MNTSRPHIARLEVPPETPAGTVAIDSQVRNGLPHAIPLIEGWEAVLTVPTGLARTWVELPPDEVIATDTLQRAAVAAGGEPPAVAPRLRMRRDGQTQAIVPLVTGWPFVCASASGRLLWMTIEAFALHAGDMRGPGNFGSFIRFSAAAADRAAGSFGPPPPSETVIQALPLISRIESRQGFKILMRYRRLRLLIERKR